jgi:hypothetical protein
MPKNQKQIKIEKIYNQAVKDLKELALKQQKIISKYIKILEKEKIEKLRENLRK